MDDARRATAADIPRILELARALRDELRGLRGGELWETRERRVDPSAEALRTLVERDGACVAVGTIDGVVVGYGTVEVDELGDGTRLGVIGDLYVEPGARAVGVGECIAEHLLAHCRQAGCRGIDALALPGHRAAKNFFERAGFTARALVMHKDLRGGGTP